MFNLTRIVLFLCIASGLTLSVNNETKTDGTSENISIGVNHSNTSSTIIQTRVDQVTSTTTAPSTKIKDLETKKSNLLQTESGPISIPPSLQSPTSNQNTITENDTTVGAQNKSTQTNFTQVVTTIEDKSLPVLDRKRGSLSLDQTTVNDEKPSIETHVTIKDDHVNINSSQGENINTKIDDKSIQLNNRSVVLPVTNLSENKFNNSTTATIPLSNKRKPNPKPTVTMGGGAADPNKPIPPSPTKSSPLGMPRKIDYIIPVAISVVALPILGVTTFILYNRGKDCWDKRHYRRMDFLIDGMYND